MREQLDERLYRTTAPNGLAVLTEHLPGLRSAAVGVWVRTASAHEPRELMGAAHLLEHMVFKGTERRSAKEIAMALEIRGGSLDAFTSRDHTSYQAHVLDADLPLAVDILTDLVLRPLLRDSDLALERNVVLEEIKAVDDAPDDLVFDLFSSRLWPDHPYGYSILGTPTTVSSITAADLKGFHRAGYYPGNCVITAAGNVDHDRLLADLDRQGWFADATARPAVPAVGVTPAARGVVEFVPRETAQAHLVWGTDTFDARDDRRYPLAIVTNVFGGGMSSRLFQRVREELGLAYGVYAFQQYYRGTGLVGVYVGTQTATADQAKDAVLAEYRRLATDGLSHEELEGGKQQLKGQLMLALENPASRMNRLAGFVLSDDRYRKLDDVLAAIDRVGSEEAAAVTTEFFVPERLSLLELGGEPRPT
ncbi:MAG: insulinase family protein [Gemmatimonadetes bacterium]|nr:insulinase family protein [Gemmatimonadota bacterium]